MTIDHIGAYLAPDDLWWRAVGRITFPVWFFLIGYARGTRIGVPLLVYAALLVVANVVLFQPVLPLNALMSIILCRLVLNLCEQRGLLQRYPAEIVAACCVLYLPTMPLFEYGTLAVAFAAFGRMVRYGMHGPRLMGIAVALAAIFSTTQWMAFDFNPAQSTLVIVGVACCCHALYHFTLKPLKAPALCTVPLMFVSRYSLEYYVLHRVVLQALALVFGLSAGHIVWVQL